MKIVEIKPRRKHISGIVFDIEIVPEDYGADVDPVGLLALDSELCEMKRLKSGTELSDEALTELVRESHIKRAKSRAMWYLSRSSMPKEKLRKKLCENFPDYAAQCAVDRAEELGFINDADYAARKIQLLIDNKKVSVKAARRMLEAEGVGREDAALAAEGAEYDPTEAILTLVERKYKRKLDDKKDFQNTVAALMRTGLSYSEIRTALKEYENSSDMYEE